MGSSLFLLPGQVAAHVGQWGPCLYLIVGLMVVSIGWCYAQCASHFSKNGGAYLYAREAFGNFVGFEIGIMRCVVGIVAWASITSGFIVALGSLYPQLAEAPYKQLLTVGIISILCVLNLFGTDTVNRLSNIIMISKILFLIFFIIFGILYIQPSHLVFTDSFPAASTFGATALLIFYSFCGFEALPVVAAETTNPKKNVPLAIMTAIIFCAFLYLVVQSICIGVLGQDLAQSSLPLVDVAEIVCGDVGKVLVSMTMIIAIGGIIVVSSFITPRNCSVMAEDQRIFSALLQQNRFGAPYVAIIASSILTCVIALSGSFVELITISVISRFASHITTCTALFALDKKGVFQPFTKPWKKVIPLFALTSIGWLLMQAELYQIAWGLGVLALGIPLYYLQSRQLVQIKS